MCILHIVFCTVCKYVLSICKLLFFCTVWSTVRISLTKALVLWWCDNKSDLIWFDLTRPSVHLPVYTYLSDLLRSSWDTPSNTHFTQTLIVRSTAHYPEPTPDPVCTYLCILTFQISYDPPEILLQIHASLRHSSSGLPLITPNRHQTQCALTCVYLPFRSPTILLRYSFKYTLHSDTHRPVYRSLPRTDTRPSVHLPVYTYLSDLLRSSWDTPSNTRFTQTLIIWSSAHYPEPTPDPVCTYLCILTFQISYDPLEILLHKIRLFLVPALHRSCKWILTSVDS